VFSRFVRWRWCKVWAVTVEKESEKKEREVLGKVEITWRTRVVFVEGHVDWQILFHKCSFDERLLSWEHVLDAEASEGPSRHVRIWVWIISGCMAEMAATQPSSSVVMVLPIVEITIVYVMY
jgi:hypothetical protein